MATRTIPLALLFSALLFADPCELALTVCDPPPRGEPRDPPPDVHANPDPAWDAAAAYAALQGWRSIPYCPPDEPQPVPTPEPGTMFAGVVVALVALRKQVARLWQRLLDEIVPEPWDGKRW